MALKGLVVAEPWISLIISGEKTWEMRSRNTRLRGRIGLIRKGSKTIVGVAELVGTLPDLSIAALRASVARHQVPREKIGDDYKYRTAWVLERARPLSKSVPYLHPAGAVIWVNFDSSVAEMIERRITAG